MYRTAFTRTSIRSTKYRVLVSPGRQKKKYIMLPCSTIKGILASILYLLVLYTAPYYANLYGVYEVVQYKYLFKALRARNIKTNQFSPPWPDHFVTIDHQSERMRSSDLQAHLCCCHPDKLRHQTFYWVSFFWTFRLLLAQGRFKKISDRSDTREGSCIKKTIIQSPRGSCYEFVSASFFSFFFPPFFHV